ncbi:hypothetical protein F4780DRAFT_788428 [Xylariomycetidae sp. FL0641]|nr:hypothetical protein F4780DRAFT_788428 [Xylariomycetidae sp. FL0641]
MNRHQSGHPSTPLNWHLALDFGTTLLSIAYCLPHQSTFRLKEGERFLVGRWPHGIDPDVGTKKVHEVEYLPTVLRYLFCEDGSKPPLYGWEAHSANNAPRARQDQGQNVSWFKLPLDESPHTLGIREEIVETMGTINIQRAASAEAQDLEALLSDAEKCSLTHESTWKRFEQFEPDQDHVVLVFTIPPAWTPQATRLMQEAIEAASSASRLTVESIRSLSETEAALAYCRESLQELDLDTRARRGVMVVDNGGGTCDATTYYLQGGTNKLKELVPSAGRLCGSVFLDHMFQEMLERDLRDAGYNPECPVFDRSVQLAKWRWSTQRKGTIRKEGRIDNYVDFFLPVDRSPLDDGGLFYLGEYCLQSAKIDDIFEPVIDDVWALVQDDQLAPAREKWTIILVGGFSDSPYLQEVIRERCLTYPGGAITPIFPPKCQRAVVEGALLWLNDAKHRADRISRYNIGYLHHTPFNRHLKQHEGGWDGLDHGEKLGDEIPNTGREETYTIAMEVGRGHTATLRQEFYISTSNLRGLLDDRLATVDGFPKTDRINASANLLETVEFPVDWNSIRRKLRARDIRGRKLFRVIFTLKVVVRDLAATYFFTSNASPEPIEGRVRVPALFGERRQEDLEEDELSESEETIVVRPR